MLLQIIAKCHLGVVIRGGLRFDFLDPLVQNSSGLTNPSHLYRFLLLNWGGFAFSLNPLIASDNAEAKSIVSALFDTAVTVNLH